MQIYQIDEETFELMPSDPTQEVFVVKVKYEFRGTELDYFKALHEDGKPANLDTETEIKIIEKVERDYLDFLAYDFHED